VKRESLETAQGQSESRHLTNTHRVLRLPDQRRQRVSRVIRRFSASENAQVCPLLHAVKDSGFRRRYERLFYLLLRAVLRRSARASV
jgi:hypothetical protein